MSDSTLINNSTALLSHPEYVLHQDTHKESFQISVIIIAYTAKSDLI